MCELKNGSRRAPVFFTLVLLGILLGARLSVAEPPQSASPALAPLDQGRVDEVISSLQGHNDAASHNLMARAYYAEDKTDEAIKEGEKAVEMSPNNAVYHLWLGRFYGQKAEKVNVLRQAGIAGKVRGEFEKAVQLDGRNADARSDLAEFYIDAPGMMGGGTDKAKAQADAIAQKDPATAHFIRAKIAEKAKDLAAAEREYKAAIDASKFPAEQWMNLAGFYKDRKNNAAMLDAVKKAASTPHRSGAVLSDAAELLYSTNQEPALAAELARKYLTANDKSEDAPAFKTHVLLGKMLAKRGDKAGAEKEFQAAAEMAKDYAPAKKR